MLDQNVMDVLAVLILKQACIFSTQSNNRGMSAMKNDMFFILDTIFMLADITMIRGTMGPGSSFSPEGVNTESEASNASKNIMRKGKEEILR